MASANVSIRELDLSTRVPTFPGIFGAIVVPALKGPTDQPRLVASDSEFLRVFTPNESLEIGMDNSHFAALAYLEKSDKLWVQRIHDGALYGGAVFREINSAYDNYTLAAGLADPSAFTFDANPDVAGVAEVTDFDFAGLTGNGMDVIGAAHNFTFNSALDATTYLVWFNVTDGANAQTDPSTTETAIQVDVLDADNDAALATKAEAAMALAAPGDFSTAVATTIVTVTNANDGDAADAADGTPASSVAITVQTQGVTEVNNMDEALLITGANEGAWNNNIFIKIVSYDTDPETVKEEDSFLIQVFKSDNLNIAVEEFIASRVLGKKDGFNRNIFVEDVLQSSNYIRGISNTAVDEALQPKDQTVALTMGGGINGNAVTDSQFITALEHFENPDDIFFNVIMDGGWATPAYGGALDAMVTARQDAVAVLSVPFSDEASANYLNDILDYRRTELNLNSSYSALYSPHAKIFDRFNDRELFVDPSGYAAAAISFSASNFEIWFPPAGFKRGLINVLDLRRRFTKAEMDVLYDAGINPLRFAPGRGILIWGQKTLQSRPSSLDRLNVRLLLISLEPAIKEALESFLFDLNDTATRSLAQQTIEGALESIQAKGGLRDFSVVVDESNNTADDIENHKMNVDVFILPPVSLEEIPVRVIITRAGVDVSTLL